MAVSRASVMRWIVVVLALLAALALHDLWRLRQATNLNALIAAGTPPMTDDATAPRELRFAQAYAHAAGGNGEAALNRYGALHGNGNDTLGRAARYNGANLLLRQAIELRAGDAPGQSLALIELAKENYRQVLRNAPDEWDARYNLERAQRLVPEPEPGDDELPELKRNAERAATTMRAYSPGLP